VDEKRGVWGFGGNLLSHITAVSSARVGLTSLFGMGRGEHHRNIGTPMKNRAHAKIMFFNAKRLFNLPLANPVKKFVVNFVKSRDDTSLFAQMM